MTYLVDIRLRMKDLFQWAKMSGIGKADLGYQVHSLFCAAYGELRPQPFRCFEMPGSNLVRVLGYSAASADTLKSTRRVVSEPLVDASFLSENGKLMPDELPIGSFSFSILCAPIVRSRDTGKEMDAFLQDVHKRDRIDVYRDWLVKRLEGKAQLNSLSMKAFNVQRVSRRKDDASTGRRVLSNAFSIPVAELEGKLTILDGENFAELFQRSIGKHGAFGLGAIFLRPSKPG